MMTLDARTRAGCVEELKGRVEGGKESVSSVQSNGGGEPAILFDPFAPILIQSRRAPPQTYDIRRNQRIRRSQILAMIRRHLTERGFDGVTVRGVAEASGHAVQTFYNLVGSRNEAIIDAISEYTRFVGRAAAPKPDDPNAIIKIIRRWLQSISAQPDFCRQVSLIFFTDSRAIYYDFRDNQLKGMLNLLIQQQKFGVVKPEVNVRELSEQLVLLSSALCLEWSDRPFPLELLQHKLQSGFYNLLSDKLVAPHRISLAH
jgi:AcrR family transcriptional regulator